MPAASPRHPVPVRMSPPTPLRSLAGRVRGAVLATLVVAVPFAATAVAAAPPAAASTAPTTLSIVAGTGAGLAPVPGPATSSPLHGPNDVAVDSAGDLYIADANNNTVEKVTPSGTLSIVAGTGTAGLPTPGPAASSELDAPSAVAVDASGDLYIADTLNDCVEKVTPSGTLSVFAGVCGSQGNSSSGVQATSVHMYYPQGVAVDASTGDVYIADTGNNVIDEVAPSGISTVVAGINQKGGAPTPGPATSSEMAPFGLALDASGNLFIADLNHHEVLEVTTAGVLSIVAGSGTSGQPVAGPATSSPLGGPNGVAFDGNGDLFIADAIDNVVEEVTPSGLLSVVAGTGTVGSPTPGPATASDLSGPAGVAVGPSGALYVADYGNNVVERIGASGTVPTFTADTPPTTATAGAPYTYTFAATGSPAPTFSVSSGALPAGLALDAATGVLTGSPTASGTFTVEATNSVGTATTSVITVTVVPAPLPTGLRTGGGVGSAAGGGLWLVTGGTLGDLGGAPDLGSMNGRHLHAPVVAVHATPSGDGYWEVAADGGVFAFGDAAFYGSMGSRPTQPVIGLVATGTAGYELVLADGTEVRFGPPV